MEATAGANGVGEGEGEVSDGSGVGLCWHQLYASVVMNGLPNFNISASDFRKRILGSIKSTFRQTTLSPKHDEVARKHQRPLNSFFTYLNVSFACCRPERRIELS